MLLLQKNYYARCVKMGCEDDNTGWVDLEEAEYQTKCIYVVNDKPCERKCRAAASLPGNLKYIERDGQVIIK